MQCTHIYYNYLLITDRIVKILALSIVSLQLAVSKLTLDKRSIVKQGTLDYFCLPGHLRCFVNRRVIQ
jgi:hypothetical protein